MRTTLTLAADVVHQLDRLRKSRRTSFKDLVNQALREGLKHLTARKPKHVPYRTKPVSLGRCLIGSIDDVAEALALAEGENFK